MSIVLVTGADGMLGSHVCRELLKQNYKVRGYCLSSSDKKCIHDLPIEIYSGDILDYNSLKKAMIGCTYVIHIAALTSVWPRRNPKLYLVNVIGTKNVMNACIELNISKLIHVGSASSFDYGPKHSPGDENSVYKGWSLKFDYCDSKYIAQEMLLKSFKEFGFPVLIINPTFMIGAYDSGPSSGRMLVNLYKRKIPGYSGGGKNFVSAIDVSVACVNAIQLGRSGECYIAGGHNLTYCDFFKIACDTLGRSFDLKRIPNAFILVAGLFSSLSAKILGNVPTLSFGLAKFALLEQYYSNHKAVSELKMPQTPIQEAIKHSFIWFKNNGYV